MLLSVAEPLHEAATATAAAMRKATGAGVKEALDLSGPRTLAASPPSPPTTRSDRLLMKLGIYY